MNTDPIIEELHQIREQFAARFTRRSRDGRLLARATAKGKNHPVVSFAQQRIETEEPATDATLKRAA